MLLLTGLCCIFTVRDIKRKIKMSLLSDDEKLFGNIQKFVGGLESLMETAKKSKK